MNQKNEGIIELDDRGFEGYIGQNKMVLVDFWAPWCMPCQFQGRMLKTSLKDFPAEARITKINVDNNPLTSMKYHIRGIPQMYLFVGGKPVKGWTGVTPVNELIREMRSHLK